MAIMLDNFAKTAKFYKLLGLVSFKPSQVTYLTVYEDKIFFDYIARVDKYFINFCLINKQNWARYQVFLKLSEWLVDNPNENFDIPLIKIVEVDGEQWFYEEMNYYDTQGILTFDECSEINSKIITFNDHVKEFTKTLDTDVQTAYNSIMRDYTPDNYMDKFNDLISLEYGDVCTLFYCNRIKKVNDNITFTGFQSFLFYDPIITNIFILLMSMLVDSYDEKESKIARLDHHLLNTLDFVIRTQEERIQKLSHEFCTDTNIILKNLNEMRVILCKQLQ